jgi:hypothetical protein
LEPADDGFPFRLDLEQLNNKHIPAKSKLIRVIKLLDFLMCDVLAMVKKLPVTRRKSIYIKALKIPGFFCRASKTGWWPWHSLKQHTIPGEKPPGKTGSTRTFF